MRKNSNVKTESKCENVSLRSDTLSAPIIYIGYKMFSVVSVLPSVLCMWEDELRA